MSSDEYAIALAQKYRLAISLAVLKTKPENLTIDEYIDEIRNTINNNNVNTQQDLDVSACSDDFNVDDDDNEEFAKNNFTQDNNQSYVELLASDGVQNDCYNIKNPNNASQIVNDHGNGNKLANVTQADDNAVRIQLNEDEIKGIVIGTKGNYNKTQRNDSTTQFDDIDKQCYSNITQDNPFNPVKVNYEQGYENNFQKIEIKRKVNKISKISGKKLQDNSNVSQDNNRKKYVSEKSSGRENNTQDECKDANEIGRDPNKERREKFREVIRILKGVDVTTEKVVKEKPVKTSGMTKSFDPTDLDLTQCYDDDDNFPCTEVLINDDCQIIDNESNLENKHSRKEVTSKICESFKTKQTPIEIGNTALSKNVTDGRKRKIDASKQKSTETEDAKLLKVTEKTNPRKTKGYLYCAKENSHKEAKNSDHNEVNVGPKLSILKQDRNNIIKVTNETAQIENIDPEDTQSTQFNTHFSESQMFDLVIDKNFIYGNKNQQNIEKNEVICQENKDSVNNMLNIDKIQHKNILTHEKYNTIDKYFVHDNKNEHNNGEVQTIAKFTQKSPNLPNPQKITDTIQNNNVFTITQSIGSCSSQQYYTGTKDCIENGPAFSIDTNGKNNVDNTEFTIHIVNNGRQITKDGQTYDKNLYNTQNINKTLTETEILTENITAFSQTHNLTQNSSIQINNKDNITLDMSNEHSIPNMETEKYCTDFDKSIVVNDMELKEKVPFKILEEMNQIKSYLSKKKEFKDSGYRSSQSQRSLSSTQPSVRVGESADSVFVYLSSCPLGGATRELTEELSEVLGQIIDRLHEDEIYPKFLEELLNAVEKLIHLVYNEDSYDFDVLQRKDEQIQRIILLNKSTHINKFTIEKINDILQNIPSEITDSKYEIDQINRLENLCYVFHILQIILPQYIKSDLYNSQNNQNSQEEILKKPDISDVWRNKWFSTKEDCEEGSLENKCVLKECSEILNKIIVSFMDGYSLIAFSALKCFNIMQ